MPGVRCDRAVAAVEFALALTPLLMLVFGLHRDQRHLLHYVDDAKLRAGRGSMMATGQITQLAVWYWHDFLHYHRDDRLQLIADLFAGRVRPPRHRSAPSSPATARACRPR